MQGRALASLHMNSISEQVEFAVQVFNKQATNGIAPGLDLMQ